MRTLKCCTISYLVARSLVLKMFPEMHSCLRAAGLYGSHNLQDSVFHDLLEWIDVSWGYVNKAAMHCEYFRPNIKCQATSPVIARKSKQTLKCTMLTECRITCSVNIGQWISPLNRSSLDTEAKTAGKRTQITALCTFHRFLQVRWLWMWVRRLQLLHLLTFWIVIPVWFDQWITQQSHGRVLYEWAHMSQAGDGRK